MSDFITKAKRIERERKCSFREACSMLGRASGRKRQARAKAEEGKRGRAGEGKREDWLTRWQRRAEGE